VLTIPVGGPRNIIPGVVVFSLLGAGGQYVAMGLGQSGPSDTDEENSIFRSKWSPMKKLTDKEYEDLMHDKILKVETEIALIDDRIGELRAARAVREREPNSGSELEPK
jgi:hypothetical protein